jgi:hypothetical protein
MNKLRAKVDLDIEGVKIKEGDTFDYLESKGWYERVYPEQGHKIFLPEGVYQPLIDKEQMEITNGIENKTQAEG